MVSLTGVEIVDAVGMGRRPEERRRWKAKGVSTDTRTVSEGDLFIAVKGERFDGHDFVDTAFARGAAGAVVSRDVGLSTTHRDRPLVRVPDTLKALGDLARYWRRCWGGMVIGITGSNGKTTTREMLWHLLGGEFRAVRSPRSFNNAIGVPLTIFQIDSEDEIAIIEMGASAPGEIAYLASIAEPDFGVVTNIGETHLEGLGSVEGVAHAKGELLEALGDWGVAFLSADDPWFPFLSERHTGQTIAFGRSESADVRCEHEEPLEDGYRFRLSTGHELDLRVPGRHNITNALAALAVSMELGVLELVADRLRTFALPDLRFQVEHIGPVDVIADCYNANLRSMTAALEAFDEMPVPGRRVLVCGDMLGMGDHAESVHRKLGHHVGSSRVSMVWALGEAAQWVVDAATEVRPIQAVHRVCVEDAAPLIASSLEPGDAVLVKGSRGMRLERVVSGIREHFQTEASR